MASILSRVSALFSHPFLALFNPPFLRRWVTLFQQRLWGPGAGHAFVPHLQQMKADADEFRALTALEDKYPPKLAPSDGPVVVAMITKSISFYFTANVFIKRQPHVDELGLDIYGNPVVNPYIGDRIRNEAAALQFVREHTTIPVPTLLDLWEENGLVYLKTGLVTSGIELRNVAEEVMPIAVDRVTTQLETEIIPQLQKLRRNFVGGADPALPVVVPHLLWTWKDTRVWPRVTAETDEFVFVHSDLDRQNILVDPYTFRIVCIVDWETAGFFPPDWEFPKWKIVDRAEKHAVQNKELKKRLALFGDEFAQVEEKYHP